LLALKLHAPALVSCNLASSPDTLWAPPLTNLIQLYIYIYIYVKRVF
jgi:hypothetical protein